MKNGLLKIYKEVFIILIVEQPQNFTAANVENY
jgi:hypothetical protein